MTYQTGKIMQKPTTRADTCKLGVYKLYIHFVKKRIRGGNLNRSAPQGHLEVDFLM